MNKYLALILLGVAGCSNQTDLGSGSNQDGLSDSEVVCAKLGDLQCGITETQCLNSMSDQDQMAKEKHCTAEVDAMLACGRSVQFSCVDGEVTSSGCDAEQEAASTCLFGDPSEGGGCGGTSTTYEQPVQKCDTHCTDGTSVSCVGDQTAVTCICETGPQVGHTFALLSCTALDKVFQAECYDPPVSNNPEACGGSGTILENGRQSCDASCQNGVSVSCEGDADGPVVCECSGSGQKFALTGCDALPSHVPGACPSAP